MSIWPASVSEPFNSAFRPEQMGWVMWLIRKPVTQTLAVAGQLSIPIVAASLLQSLVSCCCVPLCIIRGALRVGYVARHVLGHTMHIVVTRGDFCVLTQTPGGHLVRVVQTPVWCSGEMDLAADHCSRICFNRKF